METIVQRMYASAAVKGVRASGCQQNGRSMRVFLSFTARRRRGSWKSPRYAHYALRHSALHRRRVCSRLHRTHRPPRRNVVMLHSCAEQPDSPSKTDADISRTNYKPAAAYIALDGAFARGRAGAQSVSARNIRRCFRLARERLRERERGGRRMPEICNPCRSDRAASLARAWRTFTGYRVSVAARVIRVWQSSRRLCKMMRRHNHIRDTFAKRIRLRRGARSRNPRASATGPRSLAVSVFQRGAKVRFEFHRSNVQTIRRWCD